MAWPSGRPETFPQLAAQLRADDLPSWLPVLGHFRDTGSVLYVGIGAGRRAVELALAGWRVHGLEPDAAQVDALRHRLAGDPRLARILDRLVVERARVEDSRASGPFDVVLLPDLALGMTTDSDGQREVLAACAKRCRGAGAVIADVVNPGPFLAAALREEPLGDIDAPTETAVGYQPARFGAALSVAVADPAAQTFDVVSRYRVTYPDGDVREFADPQTLRWSSPYELTLLARDAGLRVAPGSFAAAGSPVWRLLLRPG